MATNADVQRYFSQIRPDYEVYEAAAQYRVSPRRNVSLTRRALIQHIRVLNDPNGTAPWNIPGTQTQTQPTGTTGNTGTQTQTLTREDIQQVVNEALGNRTIDNDDDGHSRRIPPYLPLIGVLVAGLFMAFIAWLLLRDNSVDCPRFDPDSGVAMHVVNGDCEEIASDNTSSDRSSDRAKDDTDTRDDTSSRDRGNSSSDRSSDDTHTQDRKANNDDTLEANDGGMIDLLPDGRSTNARRSLTVDPSLSKDCPSYGDTGVNSTPKHFSCTLEPGVVVISGGVVSQKHNVSDGFLSADTGTKWEDTITDGFYKLVKPGSAEGEWCTRFNQANLPANSWLSNRVKVLPSWNGCSKRLLQDAKARAN